MVALRTIRTLLGLDDWPALTPGQTITVDGSGAPVAMTGGGGTPGADGATWFTGSGVPDNATGANNDLYLDTATGDVYKKGSGVWL